MLKLSDLKIDMNSYENSLNSYIKLYPGSYMPLLLMYLSREGLIDIEFNTDANDSRILYRIEKDELKSFLNIPKKWRPIIKKYAEAISQDEDKTMSEKVLGDFLSNGINVAVFFTVFNLLLFSSSNKCLSVSIVIDVPNDSPLKKVISVIKETYLPFYDKTALFFYSYMILINYMNTKKKSDEDKWDQQFWFEEFEQTFRKIQSCSGNDEFVQPKELTQLVLSKYKGGSIYNPFAGVASYAIQLLCDLGTPDIYPSSSIGDNYYADEINELTWAIGKLRLMALYSNSNNYIHYDSSQWRSGVVNNVISTPPFGLKITNEKGEQEFADHFVIRRGLDMVVDGGLVACVVPLSFLSRKDTLDIRKTIVDNKWLEAVAYLPVNIFMYSNIRAAVLFIRKEQHNEVIFADGTTSSYKSGKVDILDEEIIANLLYEKEYDPRWAPYDSKGRREDDLPLSLYNKLRSIVYFSNITNNGYNLAPSDYFSGIVPEIEGFRLIRLKELVTGCPKPVNEEGYGKVIKPSMLSSDVFASLDTDELEDEKFDNKFNAITQDALLISPFSSIRPTLFKYNGERLLYRRDRIHAIYIDSTKIVPEYLLIELTKNYVSDQLRLKYSGDAISRLSFNDFLSIYIQVPEIRSKAIKIERTIVEEKKLLHYAKLEKELSSLKDKRHDEYVKMLRQRKHRLQQIMNEFAPAFSLVNKCRKSHGGVLHDDDIVAARTGETVESYFNKLETIVSKVENLITNLVNKEDWDEPNEIDIDRFVDRIPQNHLSDRYIIQVLHNRAYEIYEEGENVELNDARMVKINENDLSILFDNIIANASKWGFAKDLQRKFFIRIEVSDAEINNQAAVRICIANNGVPIHESIDRSRFFEWGYGTGTGIGTSQLKDIVDHYGGSIKLNEDPENSSGFCTEYEIVLPIIDND